MQTIFSVWFWCSICDLDACSLVVNYGNAHFFPRSHKHTQKTPNMKWNHCSGAILKRIVFLMFCVNVAERNSVWFAWISSLHARKAHKTKRNTLVYVHFCWTKKCLRHCQLRCGNTNAFSYSLAQTFKWNCCCANNAYCYCFFFFLHFKRV